MRAALAAAAAGCAAAATPAPPPALVAALNVTDAAVASVTDSFPTSDGPALILTTFGTGAEDDHVFVLRGVKAMLHGEAPVPELITDGSHVAWPNFAKMAPQGAVPTPSVLVAGGFLVEKAKSTGNVTLCSVAAFPAVSCAKVSTDEDAFFYHHAEWYDVDGDGRQDVVAARAKSPIPFGKKGAQLVWLKQPADPADPWVQGLLIDGGPEVEFRILDIDGDGTEEIVSTEFFVHQRLAVYECTKGAWVKCAGGDGVNVTVVDAGEGQMFDLQRVDLNGDGELDWLVTNNVASGDGAVFAYEQPGEWRTAPWPKHVLATGGYKPPLPFPGSGSPGTAIAFLPTRDAPRPVVAVSADDGGFLDLLTPTGGDWAYDRVRLYNSTGTIGKQVAADLDGDGAMELFVPDYKQGRLVLFSYGPQ